MVHHAAMWSRRWQHWECTCRIDFGSVGNEEGREAERERERERDTNDKDTTGSEMTKSSLIGPEYMYNLCHMYRKKCF